MCQAIPHRVWVIMILYINSKDRKLTEVALKKQGQVVDKLSDENEYGSQALLPLIEKLLKKNNLGFKDLKGIDLETGPGSFTGLKVGASVANALGFTLRIPVNGKSMETQINY